MANDVSIEPYHHDFRGAELQNARLQPLISDPSGEGLIWWDSALKQIQYHDGTVVRTIPLDGGFSEEAIKDFVAAMFVEGSGIDIVFDDPSDTLTISVSGLVFADLADGAEAVQDMMNSFLVAGAAVGATYNDAGNTLTLDVKVDNSSIEVSGDQLQVKALGITNAMLAGGIAISKLATDPLDRQNHTGTQAHTTITGLGTAATHDVAPTGDASAAQVVKGNDSRLTNARTPTSHGSSHAGNGSDPVPNATTSVSGLMSGTDKTKLNGIAAGATVNDSNASLRDRATHTGTQAASTINDLASVVQAYRLDQFAVPTANLNINNRKLTNVAPGTTSGDVIVWEQLESVVQGRKLKDPVKAASTGNVNVSSPGSTFDGITVGAGDRILLKNQSTPSQNGIYDWNGASSPLTRTSDADAADELTGATVLVQQGNEHSGDVFTQTTTIVTVGSTSQTWTKSGEGNTVYAADGSSLQLSGTTFSVRAAGITQTHIASSALGDGIDGGSGTVLSVSKTQVPRLAYGTLTGGATSEVLTHNLGTRNIAYVEIANPSSPWDTLKVPYERTSVNAITIFSVENLPAGYTWTIVGRKA